MNKLKADIKNWRTTIVGILTGLMVMIPQIINLLDNDPATVFSLAIMMAGLGTMGVGVAAKDGDKSSEDLGLK